MFFATRENWFEPNRNPEIAGIARGGEALASTPNAIAQFAPGERPALTAVHTAEPSSLFQAYSKYDAAGQRIESLQERWTYSWFTSAGSFEKAHTKAEEDEAVWAVPGGASGESLPESGKARLYAVVRDLRGGMAWVVREVRVQSP